MISLFFFQVPTDQFFLFKKKKGQVSESKLDKDCVRSQKTKEQRDTESIWIGCSAIIAHQYIYFDFSRYIKHWSPENLPNKEMIRFVAKPQLPSPPPPL